MGIWKETDLDFVIIELENVVSAGEPSPLKWVKKRNCLVIQELTCSLPISILKCLKNIIDFSFNIAVIPTREISHLLSVWIYV